MKAIDRLLDYLNYKGIAPTRYEKDIGMSNGYIRTMSKRNADLGETIVNNIINNSPDLNPLWLILGQGSMLKSNRDAHTDATSSAELPPGPCQQCEIREKLIKQQEESIELLKEKIETLKQHSHTDKPGDEAYRQTG